MRKTDEQIIKELEDHAKDMENVAVEFRTSRPGLSMAAFMAPQTARRAAERIRELTQKEEWKPDCEGCTQDKRDCHLCMVR